MTERTQEGHPIEFPLKSLAALFGVCWGVPWIAPASRAATIFLKKDVIKAFSKIFAVGTVITMGADGLWVMLETAEFLITKTKSEKILFESDDTRILFFIKMVMPVVLSVFSCIAPVYATIKYNDGSERYLSIITFVGNFGQGLYGYYQFLNYVSQKYELYKNESNYIVGIQNKKTIIDKIDLNLSNLSKLSDEDLHQALFQNRQEMFAVDVGNSPLSISKHSTIIKSTFQIIPTILISSASSAIGFYLAKEFFEATISNHPAVVYPCAILAEAPGMVVSIIPNYNFFGRLFDLSSLKKQLKP